MKNLLTIFAVVVAMVLVSCEKEDDIMQSAPRIKIFMSAPASDQSLKSATLVNDEPTEIHSGDTVDVQDLKNINVIFSAEDENGAKVLGTWVAYMEDSDCDFKNTDTKTTYSESSLASIKLRWLGLYQIIFVPKSGAASLSFIIRHTGLPGEVGDDYEGDFSFRMEKGLFNDTDFQKPSRAGFTIFLKSYNTFDAAPEGINLIKNWFALVYCGDNKELKIGENIFYGTRKFALKHSKYSKGYVYFSFIIEDNPPTDRGLYQIGFGAGEINNSWGFPAASRSEWSQYGTIIFKTF